MLQSASVLRELCARNVPLSVFDVCFGLLVVVQLAVLWVSNGEILRSGQRKSSTHFRESCSAPPHQEAPRARNCSKGKRQRNPNTNAPRVVRERSINSVLFIEFRGGGGFH